MREERFEISHAYFPRFKDATVESEYSRELVSGNSARLKIGMCVIDISLLVFTVLTFVSRDSNPLEWDWQTFDIPVGRAINMFLITATIRLTPTERIEYILSIAEPSSWY